MAAKRSYGTEKEIEAIAYSSDKLKYDELRCEQKEAVIAFLNGNDLFVSLPTGYGKSLCYGILPYAFDHLRSKTSTEEVGRSIVVCVSPVTSTKMDQRQSSESKVYRLSSLDKLKRASTSLCLSVQRAFCATCTSGRW